MKNTETQKITSKVAGGFVKSHPPGSKIVFGGGLKDTVERNSRVLLLVGCTKKPAFVDFLCNHFYGATIYSKERFSIKNEELTSKQESITTYIFNEATTAFRPIILDTPGIGLKDPETEEHENVKAWFFRNDRHRVDVIGVVLPCKTIMSTAQEKRLLRMIDSFPERMKNGIAILVPDSDGSSVGVETLRRLRLHGYPNYNFNTQCIYEEKQADPLKEALQQHYWMMNEKNLSGLFEHIQRAEPTTFLGMPHDDRCFSSTPLTSPILGSQSQLAREQRNSRTSLEESNKFIETSEIEDSFVVINPNENEAKEAVDPFIPKTQPIVPVRKSLQKAEEAKPQARVYPDLLELETVELGQKVLEENKQEYEEEKEKTQEKKEEAQECTNKMQLLYEMPSPGKCIFYQDVFDRLMEQVGDHKVAIVSTAGKPRGGKSFFLNFLEKKLRTGTASFDANEIIGGVNGVAFKAGFIPHTKGILVWPEVFFKTDANGKIAVILLDTQGTFDTQSDTDLTLNYFATSLLLSSIQVFNTSRNLDMQDFEALKQFISYAERSGQKAGQHLFFLIRDAPTGVGLSEEFLSTHLQGSRNAKSTHKTMGNVLESFELVESFLVPYPGSHVVNANTEIRAKDLAPSFLKNLAEAANYIVDNVQPKTFHGNVLTGGEFKNYAQQMIQSMQLKGKIKIGSFFEAYAKLSFQSAGHEGQQVFDEKWRHHQKTSILRYFPPQEFKKIAEDILESAKMAYLKVTRFGSDHQKEEQLHKFLGKLRAKNEELEKFNCERYRDNRITDAFQEAIHKYDEESNKQQGDILERLPFEEVEKNHMAAHAKALQHFWQETKEYQEHPKQTQKHGELLEYLDTRLSRQKQENALQTIKESVTNLCNAAYNEFYSNLMERKNELATAEDIEEMISTTKFELNDFIDQEKDTILDAIYKDFPHLSFDEANQHLDNFTDKTLEITLPRAEKEFRVMAENYLNQRKLKEELVKQKEDLRIAMEAQRENTAEEIKLLQEQMKATLDQMKQQERALELFRNDDTRREEEDAAKNAMHQREMELLMLGMQKQMEQLKQRKEEALEKIKNKPFVIGIDLGTTYSSVAVYVDQEVIILENEYGHNSMPSLVSFTEGEPLVGGAAKYKATANLQNTVYGVKRMLGQPFKHKAMQEYLKHVPFTVVESEGKPKIEVRLKEETKLLTPLEVSSVILKKLKTMAEKYLDRSIERAVITVPAYFSDTQRKETKSAAQQAGLEVLRLVNEPTAAAIAFGIQNLSEQERKIMVFDFGGGTLDVSILKIKGSAFDVIAISGDTYLGGEDLNEVLLKKMLEELQTKHGKDLSGNRRAVSRLRIACEEAKIELTSKMKTELEVKQLILNFDFKSSITRANFEVWSDYVFKKALTPVKNAMNDAKLTAKQIDEVIMVGGTSRIPKIQEMLSQFLGGKKLNTAINGDEAVVFGAAIQAAKLSGNPCPDLKHYRDVTPLSLGVLLWDGSFRIIIPRNTPIPTRDFMNGYTLRDYQEIMSIQAYEGERRKAKANTYLGKFSIDLPRAKKGIVVVKISFDLNDEGILDILAEEAASGSSNSLKINMDSDQVDVQGRLADAQENQETDAEFERRAKALRDLDTYAYSMKELSNKKFTSKSEEAKAEIKSRGQEELRWIYANSHDELPRYVYEKRKNELVLFCDSVN